MSDRTTQQLARIKQLLIQDNNSWLGPSNVIITDNGKEKMDGIGQAYVLICVEGQSREPFGDANLFVTTNVGIYIHYNLNVDQRVQYSKLTTTVLEKAEDIINCIHMRYDPLFVEPIKLTSSLKVDIDRDSNWAVCGLQFDVLQVESYLR